MQRNPRRQFTSGSWRLSLRSKTTESGSTYLMISTLKEDGSGLWKSDIKVYTYVQIHPMWRNHIQVSEWLYGVYISNWTKFLFIVTFSIQLKELHEYITALHWMSMPVNSQFMSNHVYVCLSASNLFLCLCHVRKSCFCSLSHRVNTSLRKRGTLCKDVLGLT